MSAIIDKVRKLMRLAESPNANEAAAAAAKAQQLIDEHNLSAAMLTLETGVEEPDEDIEDFGKKGAPLDSRPKADRWRITLASNVAYGNGCRIYYTGGTIALVGRPSDADAVRYLYGYLAREVDRLAERDGRGCGRTWRNNYRLGVVDTISRKLREQREKFKQEAQRAVANTQALMVVNRAIAKVEKRGTDVTKWMDTNLKLRSGSASQSAYDPSARVAGRRAGESIAINRAQGKALSA